MLTDKELLQLIERVKAKIEDIRDTEGHIGGELNYGSIRWKMDLYYYLCGVARVVPHSWSGLVPQLERAPEGLADKVYERLKESEDEGNDYRTSDSTN